MTVAQPLILFFTDFGTEGPYLGQMEAAIMSEALQSRVINLISDAPACDPLRAGYLLAALTDNLPPGCVVVAVVDPGVGGEREPVILEAGGRLYVGPDNGLLVQVAKRDKDARLNRIDWRPEHLSETFHGRDIFAPVAGLLSTGQSVEQTPLEMASMVGLETADDLAEVVYVDRYGNAITGLRASQVADDASVCVNGVVLTRASAFTDVEEGGAFWYRNSSGLVELACNRARADQVLGLAVGSPVSLS